MISKNPFYFFIFILIFNFFKLISVSAGELNIQYSIEADINSDNSEIIGQQLIKIKNNSSLSLNNIYLFTFAEKLKNQPELDEITTYWHYPERFNPAGLNITKIELLNNGAPITVESYKNLSYIKKINLNKQLQSGESITLKINFIEKIPEKWGRFGISDGEIRLLSNWFPQVVNFSSKTGWDLFSPPAESENISISINGRNNFWQIINNKIFSPGSKIKNYKLKNIRDFNYLSFDDLYIINKKCINTDIKFISSNQYPAPYKLNIHQRNKNPLQINGLRDLGTSSYASNILYESCNILRWLNKNKLIKKLPHEINLIEIPLRNNLISFGDKNTGFVSDKLYRIFPLKIFNNYHTIELHKLISMMVLSEQIHLNDTKQSEDVLELISTYFAKRYNSGQKVESILRWFSFIPLIDQILYAPQVQFRSLFFHPLRDEDPIREEPWRYMNKFIRGSVIYDRLLTFYNDMEIEDLIKTYLSNRRSFIDLLKEDISRKNINTKLNFNLWNHITAEESEFNYKLGKIKTTQKTEGFENEIEVFVEGKNPQYPLEISWQDENGNNGIIKTITFEDKTILNIKTETPLEQVIIDPEHRLPESEKLTTNNPSSDNYFTLPWRVPVFDSFVFDYLTTEGEITALIDLTLRRSYDLKHFFRLRLEYEPQDYGAAIGYYYGWGKPKNLNFPSWLSGVQLGLYRYRNDPLQIDKESTGLNLDFVITHDTRSFYINPMYGHYISFRTGGGLTMDDNGNYNWKIKFNARGYYLLTPAVGHTFAFYGGAGIIFGNPTISAELESLADRFKLRAFKTNETLGRASLYGVIEYRWTFASNLDLNLFHLTRLWAMQLVLFGATGTNAEKDNYADFGNKIFLEAGFGLRLLFNYLGVQPAVFSIDFAVPILPSDILDINNPFEIYISFSQSI